MTNWCVAVTVSRDRQDKIAAHRVHSPPPSYGLLWYDHITSLPSIVCQHNPSSEIPDHAHPSLPLPLKSQSILFLLRSIGRSVDQSIMAGRRTHQLITVLLLKPFFLLLALPLAATLRCVHGLNIGVQSVDHGDLVTVRIDALFQLDSKNFQSTVNSSVLHINQLRMQGRTSSNAAQNASLLIALVN